MLLVAQEIVMVLLGLLALILLAFVVRHLNLYVRAVFSNAGIRLFDLVGMSLRKVNAAEITNARIRIVQAGITDVPVQSLEAHSLAGGNIIGVVTAIIAADRARIPLDFQTAAAIDLAGRDVLDAVQTSVNPKVIDCPRQDSARKFISAVAKDGIELRVKARVTVRTNIQGLVGGATEETVIARVGEGIITTIGSSADHKVVLENPDAISRRVLSQGLDSGTAYDILSIDIADIDVGDNIGSMLQTKQAEADLLVAQAKAEERKAMAIARDLEMQAEVQANRAKVVQAEAEVPLAIAEAFRSGHLGIMDYARLENVRADTTMRRSISKEPGTES